MNQGVQMRGLALPVGMGKTERALQMARVALTAGTAQRVAMAVPDHRLGAEVERRARDALGARWPVATWRGLDQPDPADAAHRMCRRGGEAEEVRRAGGSTSDLCNACPLHPARGGPCAYRGQEAVVKAAALLVVPHACLRAAPPEAIARGKQDTAADLLVIDEAFWTSMLCGPVTVDAAALDPALWDPAALLPSGFDPVRAALARLALKDVGDALRALPAGRVDGRALAGQGVTNAGALRDARAFAWAFKVDLARLLPPPGSAAAMRAALAGAAGVNRRVQDVARVLTVAADVLDGRLGPAALRIEDSAAGRVVRLRWREDIHPRWIGQGGVIHADATMQDDIVRVFLPGLVVQRPAAPPAAPGMIVKQITDRAFGYGSLIDAKARSEDAKKAARANLERVRRLVETVDRRHPGGTLAVLPKAAEAALAGKLPVGVGTLHFANLRGVDAYGRAKAAVIVSRPLPPPAEVEDLAELLFGPGVLRLPEGTFYKRADADLPLADGSAVAVKTPRHSDPRAEAVRAAICDAELVQAVGRVRGLRRTEANPVTVYVLTNVPLPGVTVTEARTLKEAWAEWGGADPVAALLEAGVVPEDWPGRGAVLRGLGFLAGVKDVGGAARALLRRRPGAEARLMAGVGSLAGHDRELRTFLDRKVYIEERPQLVPETPPGNSATPPAAAPWPRFRYRTAGRRQASVVAVHPSHAEPHTAAEAAGLGPLDEWAPATAPPRRATAKATATIAAIPRATVTAAPIPLTDPTPASATLELPAVMAVLGLPKGILRDLRFSPRTRALDKKLRVAGYRKELRDALLVRQKVGEARFAAAILQVQAQATGS